MDVKQHGCAIVNEGSLYHHGGTAEDLYIGIEQSLEEAYHCPVHRILLAVGGDCLHNAHRKAVTQPMAVEITAITMVFHAPERSMEPYSFRIYATQPKKSFASGSAIGFSLLI